MLSVEKKDDYVPRVLLERHRSSSSSSSSSPFGAIPFSPLLLIDGLSRGSFSYNKLPQHPLKLSVLKLDGSSFDIEVTKTATVAELKQAVEGVFSHFPKKGPGKISWSHLWGNFCLCYDGQNLVTENEYIRNYGIKDGDQIHFIRHLSITYNLTKKRSKKRALLKEHRMLSSRSDDCEERQQNGKEDDDFDDLENVKHQHYDDKDEDLISYHESRLAHFLKGWFSYSRLATTGRRFEGKAHSSRFAYGFLGSFGKIIRLYRNKPKFLKSGMERGPMNG